MLYVSGLHDNVSCTFNRLFNSWPIPTALCPGKENISHFVIKFVQVGSIWVMISQKLWYTAYSAVGSLILTPDLLSIIIDILDTARYHISYTFTVYDR